MGLIVGVSVWVPSSEMMSVMSNNPIGLPDGSTTGNSLILRLANFSMALISSVPDSIRCTERSSRLPPGRRTAYRGESQAVSQDRCP